MSVSYFFAYVLFEGPKKAVRTHKGNDAHGHYNNNETWQK